MKFISKHLSRITLLFAAVMVCLAFTSCDDDDYYNNPLVGRWELVAPTDVDYNCFYFYPDGTGQYYVDDFWGEDWYYFSWEVNGPNLAVYFNNGDVWYYSWTVQGSSLYLYAPGENVPYVYNYF
ncbi:MAG: hypothetical protein HDR90_08550 [Bacteroides sp.]|nr:hypothetical protein [Bacteroides sp.]